MTAYYILILAGLVTPGAAVLLQRWGALAALSANFGARWPEFANYILQIYGSWPYWVLIGLCAGGQVLLLFLSVDTSWKRLRPRRHVGVSILYISMLFGLLTLAAVSSLVAGIFDDKGVSVLLSYPTFFLDIGKEAENVWMLFAVLGIWLTGWMIWAVLFFRCLHNSSDPVARLVSWLLKGSVLELLIAVPCHVVVRHRNDCSAPYATGFGIATGIAIMLLSFGPSVLILYKKRLDGYGAKGQGA